MRADQLSPRYAVTLLGLVMSSLIAFGQATTSLRGTLTDPAGAVIPQAVVTLNNAENGAKRRGLSSAEGEYQFLQVAPGTYQLVVEKAGFTTITRDGLQLLVNTPAAVDLRMEIGKTGDVVNVTADASVINTVDASIGNAFSERQVRQLPLATRNVVELLSLQPGVSPDGEVMGAR